MPNPKILIVDDEIYNVDYLEQELEDLEYSLISASNGQQALDKVDNEAPDLILLDIMMPIMDGFEVLARLKANPATRDIPVIVISANNDLNSVVRGIQLGAEDYLPKPFEPTLLHARLASCLEKKHLRDLQQLYLKGLERELDIAREIQLGFLPTELPKVDGWEIAAYFKAAHEVAGDFYDAFFLPDGNLLCVIGDVCDKGVGAALFMTLFRSLIRATATTGDFSTSKKLQALTPSERLQHVISFTNNYVSETHGDANMFATVFIGIFNLADGTLSYINCGNESPLILRNGAVAFSLQPTGPVVGVIPQAKFSVKEIFLDKNDLFLAFTDGIPDALNTDNISFGSERLLKLLAGVDTAPAALLKNIAEHLRQFISTADQFDDITLLALKRVA
ncbi:MAG: SpoIIE family protein phosphatase [Chloroflexi bacterium]|nr:SpoIIE family protein phosphatase [Chloroflexota bacterium]